MCLLQVTHFNHSVVSLQALADYQLQHGVSKPLKLVKDVATRWNSQLHMAKRLLSLRVAIFSVLHDERVTKASDRRSLEISASSWAVCIFL